MDRLFQIGERVTWTAQAHGRTYTKVGQVVCLIAANQSPFRRVRTGSDGQKCYQLPNFGPAIPCKKTVNGGGLSRKGVSYVVQSGDHYYWPLASRLQLLVDAPKPASACATG